MVCRAAKMQDYCVQTDRSLLWGALQTRLSSKAMSQMCQSTKSLRDSPLRRAACLGAR